MISSLILDKNPKFIDNLCDKLATNCPFLKVVGKVSCLKKYTKIAAANKLDLIFTNIEFLNSSPILNLSQETKIILILDHHLSAIGNSLKNITSCLCKPIQDWELIREAKKIKEQLEVKRASEAQQILLERILKAQPQKELIGVPTIEGYEFVSVEKIIRCEGLQKCTRIITTEKLNIVSSYNIGEFKKILQFYGFFSPHRSYLINLRLIEKYHKEGTIIMCDKAAIPVARRRKEAFLRTIQKI